MGVKLQCDVCLFSGAKRRHSADTMRPDSPDTVETDHVSRPITTGVCVLCVYVSTSIYHIHSQ